MEVISSGLTGYGGSGYGRAIIVHNVLEFNIKDGPSRVSGNEHNNVRRCQMPFIC